MYKVMFSVDFGENWYCYGTYPHDEANVVAWQVREERGCWVDVEKVED